MKELRKKKQYVQNLRESGNPSVKIISPAMYETALLYSYFHKGNTLY